MPRKPDPTRADMALFQLIPNMLTILAICAGLSAIRFGIQGNFALAVALILLAGILDGLDGRVARLLSSESKMGAELDSLADFLNFGVAPPLILYFWALDGTRGAWIVVMVFAVCCVLRLARFNVSAKSDDETTPKGFFIGLPSPAGAFLVLLPMYVAFAFPQSPQLPDALLCVYLCVIGLAMISRIPVWSFKTTRISRKYAKFALIGVAVVAAALLSYAWITLIVLCLGYICLVAWGLIAKTPSKTDERS